MSSSWLAFSEFGEIRRDRHPFGGQADRRLHHLLERHRAVFFQRQRQAGDRPRHADGHAAVARQLAVGLAGGVQKHVAAGAARRLLAVVDRHRLAGRRMHDHEAAAAEIAGLRQRHGEREADRHGGVDRIAAGFEHVHADLGGQRLLARHHAVFRPDRVDPVHARKDRRVLREGRAGERSEEREGSKAAEHGFVLPEGSERSPDGAAAKSGSFDRIPDFIRATRVTSPLRGGRDRRQPVREGGCGACDERTPSRESGLRLGFPCLPARGRLCAPNRPAAF